MDSGNEDKTTFITVRYSYEEGICEGEYSTGKSKKYYKH